METIFEKQLPFNHDLNANEASNDQERSAEDMLFSSSSMMDKFESKFGLHRNEILPQFRIPFINTGYRRPNLKVIECFHSALILTCNETINFWSHFIAFILFAIKFKIIFTSDCSLYDSATWPLLSASLGVCGFCFASSSAHLFNSMSPSAQHSCFFMDYAAIGVYSVAVGQAFFFYSRPIQPEVAIFQSALLFTIISSLTSITTTVLCCASRHRWLRHKYIIRTSSFVAPFLVNASPYLYRMIYCFDSSDSISHDSLRVFGIHCFFYAASALINMLRVPERVFPGKFDLFGHSHHFLHIFTAVGASYQFDSIHIDMIERHQQLHNHSIQANFMNTLLPLVLSFITNFGIALMFGMNAYKIEKEKEK